MPIEREPLPCTDWSDAFLPSPTWKRMEQCGVRRIFKEAQKQGFPMPEIVKIGMRLRFIIPLSESLVIQAARKVTPQVVKVVTTIKGEMTRSELMEVLELKDRMYFIREYLKPVVESDFIK